MIAIAANKPMTVEGRGRIAINTANSYVEHVKRRGGMLGIRLSADAEGRLAKHAREAGRPKSVIARDWIMDRLEREEVDRLIRDAATLHAEDRERLISRAAGDATDALLRWLDAEDGGYDWGPNGPPPAK